MNWKKEEMKEINKILKHRSVRIILVIFLFFSTKSLFAKEETYNFLKYCIQFENRCVRVIHGKGLRSAGKEPVLKSHVKSWLKQYNGVLAYCQAPGRMGGSGALIVLLKARCHRSLPSYSLKTQPNP